MIIVYIGRRGAGKTLSMVKDAYLYNKQGRRVISNMQGLNFGEYMSNDQILKIDKNSDIKHAVMLIDEIQIFFDSRRSMNKGNISFSNFVQQIRKRDIIMLGTTQFSNSIDKRLRDHTDVIARPKFVSKFNVCEVRYIDVTSTQDDENFGIPDEVSTVFNALEVFSLYNTGEMVK